MMKFSCRWLLLVLVVGCSRNVPAEEAAPTTIPVANKQDLAQAIGKDVRVLGKVSHAGKSSSGHVFLNFAANPQFTVFVDKQVVAQFQDQDPAKAYEGKTVVVSGKVERFKEKLQISLESPMKISLAEATVGDGEEELKPVELESLGKGDWISPAGVKYVGKDPDGLSRKDHVLRHAKDIPDRDGPHGVFDGGEELAFAWIDAAWRKIKTDKMRPQTETGRDTYTVSMGRRVGFLGGKTGAQRKHPPLTKIFLVVREGTSEVITAFPR
jgi:hypothetical protein